MQRPIEQDFSIIVPTFQEAKNLTELVQRIAAACGGEHLFEVIIVDDYSQDGTEETIKILHRTYPWLRLVVRKEKKGLSSAVMDGLAEAQYPICVVMDADLSHPPEKIPELIAALKMPEVDFVLGSRYIEGGSSDHSWPKLRQWASKGAAFMARQVVPFKIKDPLSGFLAFRKASYYSVPPLTPIGWKIGIEMMVKCAPKKIYEVPIHFAQRARGTSKLTSKTIMQYFYHLWKLEKYKQKQKRLADK